MNRQQLFFYLLVAAILFAGSCIPYRKRVPLDGDKDRPLDTSKVFEYQREEYRLQVNDIIDIQITSPNPEAAIFFDKTFQRISGGMGQMAQMAGQGGDVYYMTGYAINSEGMVQLPVLGNLDIVGLTTEEARALVEDELSQYFEEDYFYVQLKLGGIRFIVQGEVRSPGKFVALQNQLTIFEAIAMAGDFNTYANLSDIVIIRQYPNGTKAHRVNLLDQDALSSDFYFVRPNDQIMVKPLKIKVLGISDNALQNVSSLIGITTSFLTLYFIIQN